MAWIEFEELKAEHEKLLILHSGAENYAHQVGRSLFNCISPYESFI